MNLQLHKDDYKIINGILLNFIASQYGIISRATTFRQNKYQFFIFKTHSSKSDFVNFEEI